MAFFLQRGFEWKRSPAPAFFDLFLEICNFITPHEPNTMTKRMELIKMAEDLNHINKGEPFIDIGLPDEELEEAIKKRQGKGPSITPTEEDFEKN